MIVCAIAAGCAAPAVMDAGGDQRQVPNIVGGANDVTDAYPGVVSLLTNGAGCSGTLIASGRVLTAGHCVCQPHAPGTPIAGVAAVFEPGRDCATASRVSFRRFRDDRHADMNGRVIVHPAFRMTLDASGRVVSATADLALVDLWSPADVDLYTPIPPSRATPNVGDVVVEVGFGTDTCAGATLSGWRRFGTNVVSRSDASTITVTNTPGGSAALTHFGDSGGALVEAIGFANELVGVTSRGDCPNLSTFTTVATEYSWIVGSCVGCAAAFSAPSTGTMIPSGGTLLARWSTTNLGSHLRLVVRKDGMELLPPASTTISPAVTSQAITIRPEWGTGTGFELCLASDLPVFSRCSSRFTVTAAGCLAPSIPCLGSCVDPTSDNFNCGGCGIRCGPVETCMSSRCTATSARNLLLNGGFEDTSDIVYPPDPSWRDGGWSTYSFDASLPFGTCAIVTGASAEAIAHARCDVGAAAGEPWHFLLLQSGFTMTNGSRYSLSFSARANASRTVEVSVQSMAGTSYAPGPNWVASVGPSWTSFSRTFVASVPPPGSDSNAKLAFWLLSGAAPVGRVEFDDVRLVLVP